MKLTNRIVFFVLIQLFSFFANKLNAATKTSTISGSWNVPATWGGAAIPAFGDDVIISSNTTVTLGSSTAKLYSLTIQSGATLINSTYTLYLGSPVASGKYTNNGVHNGPGEIFYDCWACNGGGTEDFDGSGVLNCNINIGSGGPEFLTTCNLTINGNIYTSCNTFCGGGISNAGNITIIGDVTLGMNHSINFTNSGIVNQIGNTIIGGGGVLLMNYGTYSISNNLVIGGQSSYFDNAGTVTVGNDLLGDNFLDNDCVFQQEIGGYAKFGHSVFPAANEGQLVASGLSINTGLNIEPNTIEYNGMVQVLKTPSAGGFGGGSGGVPNTYSNLIISNTSTKSLESNTTINGNLSIKDAAQLDVTVSTYSINVYGNWENTSTHTNPFVERTGIVTFKGSSTQTITASAIKTETYYDLRIVKTNLNNDVILKNNITVTNTLTLTKGGLSLNSDTLYIVNPYASAIDRDSGYVKSETNSTSGGYSYIDWKIGNGVGNYQFPFGKTSATSDYIPVTFSITAAGDTAGSISIATYSTTSANLPLPTGVNNVRRNGLADSAFVVDRFWIINANYTITKPIATFTLTATAAEVDSITNLAAQRWNSTANVWELPLPNQSNSIASAAVPNVNNFSPWTLSAYNNLLGTKPIVIHTPNITLCYGSITQLTAVALDAVAYKWGPTNTLTTTGGNVVANPTINNTYFIGAVGNPIVLASPTNTITYSLIVSNNSGIDTSYITVTVPEEITAIILPPSTSICSGESYGLLSKTNVNTTPHFLWNPVLGLDTATIFNPTTSPQVSTTYTLTVSDDWNCYHQATTYIHVEAQPTLFVSAPATICVGMDATLNASIAGGTLSWSNNSTATNITVTPDSTTTYAAFGNNSYCLVKEFIKVTVISLPTVSAGNNQFMCVGAVTGATLNGIGNSNNAYVWTPNIYLTPNNTTISTNANPPIIGSYEYTLTATEAHGCSSQDAIILTVGNSLEANVGKDLTICSGIAMPLNATITSGSTIVWSPAIGLTSNTISSPTLNFATLQLLNYSITVSAPGCNDEADYLTVQVLQSPQLVTSNVSICTGTIPALSVSGADVCVWYPNQDTTFSLSPVLQVSTSYTIIGINNNGCEDTASIQINVYNLPNVSAGSNITASTSKTVNLTASGASIYLWSPAENLECSTCPSPEIKNKITQQYYLQGKDANGCINIDSVAIKFIVCDEVFVPEAFSPNADGENDELRLITEDSQCIKEYHLQIFDRWGNIVFESGDITQSWNGYYNGKELDDAVLVYQMKMINVDNDGISKKGNLSLIK